jgi:hypothetical protein
MYSEDGKGWNLSDRGWRVLLKEPNCARRFVSGSHTTRNRGCGDITKRVLTPILHLEILGFVDFILTVRYSEKLENTPHRRFRLLPSSGEGGDTCSVGLLRKN